MFVVRFLLLLILISFQLTANAGTQTGQITRLIIRASDGLVYFHMSGTATNKPACAKYEYWMIKLEDSPAGKRQLAALLAAKSASQTITVVGANTCTRWNDGEDIEEIHLT